MPLRIALQENVTFLDLLSGVTPEFNESYEHAGSRMWSTHSIQTQAFKDSPAFNEVSQELYVNRVIRILTINTEGSAWCPSDGRVRENGCVIGHDSVEHHSQPTGE